MTLLRASILLALVAMCAMAQTINNEPFQTSYGLNFEAKILMPASAARLTITGARRPTSGDVQIHYAVISNVSASAATFTIRDGDGNSYAMFLNVSIAANSTYVVPLPATGLQFTGGLYTSSSSGGLVLRVKGWTRE